MSRALLLLAGCWAVAACATTSDPAGEAPALSEAALAAMPADARLDDVYREADGCYWILQYGTVKDNFVPLVNGDGDQVCDI